MLTPMDANELLSNSSNSIRLFMPSRQQAASAGCEHGQMYPSGRMLAAVMRDVSRTATISGRAASGGDLWIPTVEGRRSLLSDAAAPLRPVVLTKHSEMQASLTVPQTHPCACCRSH